jgi:hypothetical protein
MSVGGSSIGAAGAPVADRRRSRRGLVVAGIVVLVAGVVGAAAMWLAAEQRYDDGVNGLARAAVGCETVLDFEEPGEFLLFAETAGSFDDVRGDCTATGTFQLDTDSPEVSVELLDPDGSPVETRPATGADYDRGGSRGQQIAVVQITSPGDHVVRVLSDDGSFVVAVGHDPVDGVFVFRAGAVLALVAGFVLGLVLIIAGRRASTAASGPAPGWPTPVVTATPWWEGGSPPTVSSPPQRPSAPPLIPGQPPGPGWVVPTFADEPAPGRSQPVESPPRRSPAEPERSPWAPPGSG